MNKKHTVINRSDLDKAGKSETWKYFAGVSNCMDSLRVYKLLSSELLLEKNEDWRAILEGKKEISESEKMHFPVGDMTTIDGVNISRRFIIGLHIKSFFQSAKNCFDYLAQLINEFFVDDKISKVDFDKFRNMSNRIPNNYRSVRNWVMQILQADEYKYITDYCNTVKHNYDLCVSDSVDFSTLDISIRLPAFSKENNSYDSVDSKTQMLQVQKFVFDSVQFIMSTISNQLSQDN